MTWVSEGRQRGEIPVDFEIFRKKSCFRSFAWEKTNFTTFVPPRKSFEKSSYAPLETIVPTPMVDGMYKKVVFKS